MLTFILDRPIPQRYDVTDPAQVALHCRWAVDAYAEAGVVWFGGAATEDRMFSLIAADDAEAPRRYCRSLGVDDAVLRRVVQPLGPTFALPRDDPRFRPPVR